MGDDVRIASGDVNRKLDRIADALEENTVAIADVRNQLFEARKLWEAKLIFDNPTFGRSAGLK